jgi:hypothetical protein
VENFSMKSQAMLPQNKTVSDLRGWENKDFQYATMEDAWHNTSLMWIQQLQIKVPAGKPLVMSTSLKFCKFTKNSQTFPLINLRRQRPPPPPQQQ